MAFSPLTDKPCKSDILAWGWPPSNFPSAPKVITSSDLEASQPVIFSELLNRAARAKQATNWGQHLTKYFLPINTCCKPIVRGRWHPQMQVCKSVQGRSSQTRCLCTPLSGFLPPAMIDLTTSPTLVTGQRRSGGLKLQQSTNSSHVVILVANSNDKRLQRSCGLNLNIRPLVKVSLRGVWNPTPNSLFGWRNKLDVEKWQEATWSQTERTLIDDIFFEK